MRLGDRPVDLAEQALAGGLLLDPEQVLRLRGWLQPSDFGSPGCAAVYEAVRHQVGAGSPTDAASIRDQLLRMDLHPDYAQGTYLHSLMSACPTKPDLLAYGEMVVEAGLRRHLHALGERVERISWVPAPTNQITQAVAHARSLVDQAAQRWDAALAHEPAVGTSASVELGAVVPVDGVPFPAEPERVARAEANLVAAILLRAELVDELRERLRPDDFQDEQLGVTYRAAVSLREQGRHIDVVTLSWEQQRLSRQHGGGAPVGQLRELAAAADLPSPPKREVEIVLAAALNRLASAAAASVQSAALNPGVNPHDLLDTAALTYRAVEQAAARMSPSPAASLLRNIDQSLTENAPSSADYEHPGRHLQLVQTAAAT